MLEVSTEEGEIRKINLTEALFKGFPLNVLRDTFRTSGLQLSLMNATLPTGVIEGNILTCKKEFASYQPTFPRA
eukprot:jgi/Chlat1/6362/Chrsp44S05825